MANRFAWGCEGGGVGEEAATRGKGVIVRALARAPRRVPPRAAAPGPGAADWKAAAGRPSGGLLGNDGRNGGCVGPLKQAGLKEEVGTNSVPQEKPIVGPEYPGRCVPPPGFGSRLREVTTPHTDLFRPAPWKLSDA